MFNSTYSYDFNVESAYIISLINNPTSEVLTQRCIDSCVQVKMPYKVCPAFDGTDNKNIQIPDHLKDRSWLRWLKIFDHHLSVSEIATVLSHFSLWCHCIELDRPIVILEHDAILIKPFTYHNLLNSIIYLGSIEQKNGTINVVSVAPHSVLNQNYHFICRAHAYSIDPAIAKNMVVHILQNGIHESLDIMLRCDLFSIAQFGFYAYDQDSEITTITSRKKDIRLGSER